MGLCFGDGSGSVAPQEKKENPFFLAREKGAKKDSTYSTCPLKETFFSEKRIPIVPETAPSLIQLQPQNGVWAGRWLFQGFEGREGWGFGAGGEVRGLVDGVPGVASLHLRNSKGEAF